MFTYSSTGWALWNMQLGALTQGASIVLYEGSPGHPPGAVWEVAARTKADVMLLGAAVVTASANAGVSPRQEHNLRRLRHLMVSGSALPSAGYHWVMEHVSADVRIDSTSGGTDISGSFVGSNEYASVREGRIGGRLAGVDCAAWDENGVPVVDTVGDLVITQPMPSMPVCLWGDPDAVRYTESYFDTWPGVWRHGDWVTMHSDGSISIHGRSDSTLNRQGVRLGSSDFYDVLETLPEITETLVIGIDLPENSNEHADRGYWLGLFVVPAPGHALDDALKQKIVTTLRTRLTPRHVPDEILEAPAVPHTLSGKRLEVPIKKLLTGKPLEKAANLASVDDPDALRWYARFAADRLR
jgi:acetoacetyl-CoA synthetase